MKKILLALIVSLMTFFEFEAINVKQLKGTHDIAGVPSDYAPVMGMALLEWRVLRQWYELSSKYMKSEITELLQNAPKADLFQKQSIEELQKSFTDDAIENLLHLMFHIATGNFNVTHALDNPVMQLKAEHIGKILRVVHDWTSALSDPKKLEELKERVKQEPKQVRELLSELSRMSPRVKQIKKQATLTPADQQFLNDYEAKHKKMVRLRSKHASTLRSKKETDAVFVSYNLKHELMYLVEDFGFENSQKKLFKAANWSSFVNSLVDALKLQQAGPDQVYAQNTVQEILLGYMLAKSHNRSDLENYFKGFLGDDNFVLPEEAYTDQEIKDIIASQVNAHDFKPFSDLMCAFTYQEKYASTFPKIVEGNDRVEYQGVGFADCMETAMRNLVNIITYQGGKLGVAPEGLTMNPQLQKFYRTPINSDNASVGHKDVHQNWTDVIENIEGASYDYLGYQGHRIASGCDGFIFVDNLNNLNSSLPKKSVEIKGKTIELIEKKVDGRTYLLVAKSPDLFGCELMPNMANMVVVLNNLFNLQLYPSSKDVIQPDFASKYLELTCEKLGWTLRSSKLEGLNAELYIASKQGNFKMKLSNKIHGSLEFSPKDQLKINLVIPEDTQQSRIAVAISDQLVTKDNAPKAVLTSCAARNVDALSYDARIQVANGMLFNWSTLSFSEKNYVQKMIVSFGLHADRYYLESIIKNIPSTFEYKDFLLNVAMMFSLKNPGQSIDLLGQMIKKNLLGSGKTNNILSLVGKGIDDPDFQIRLGIIDILQGLITNQLITFDQALPFLEKGINDPNSVVQEHFARFIPNLAINKLITGEQALAVLVKGINKSNLNCFKSLTILISNKLIKFEQALPFLQKGITDTWEQIRSATMDSIYVLINNKLITFEQALPFLEKGINDLNLDSLVGYTTMRSLNKLIKNKSIPADQALPFLEKGMSISDSDLSLEYITIESLKNLIDDKLISFDQALPVLQKGINSSSENVRSDAIQCINSFIENKLITTDQIKQLITTNPEQTVLEWYLKQAQAQKPAMEREGMLSRGAFRSTPVASMRHEPYATDVVGRELALRGMSAQEVGEEFEQQYAKDRAQLMQQQGEPNYQIPDLELQRQKFEEQQQMQPSLKNMYDHSIQTHATQRILPITSRLVQQRRLMSAKELLPRPSDFARRGVRGIVR